jgi:hypothetical protein
MKKILFIISLFLISCHLLVATQFFVATNGSSVGNGSKSNPWNLQTALDHPSAVKAGDTIWIAGGIYKGIFTGKLKGTQNAPIIVRVVPGEEAVLDGNVTSSSQQDGILGITGQDTWYWGFTITNTATTVSDFNRDGVHMTGANNKLINCRIYNTKKNGVGFWLAAVNAEIYGCIIYNNGFKGPSRGHGHGIYSQNLTGTKVIRDNIMFNAFGYGIHIYTEGSNIQGYQIEGNILFNNGIPGGKIERNILIGGRNPADRIFIRDNYLVNRSDYASSTSLQLGYSGANLNAEVTGNVLVNGALSIIKAWNSIKVTDNQMYTSNSERRLINFEDFSTIVNPNFSRNKYFGGTLNNNTFSNWQTQSRQDANSTYSIALPVKSSYSLRKNVYDPGRAHLVVLNWDRSSSIGVDLSPLVSSGSKFQVWDAVNFAYGPILSDTYSGGLYQIPLNASKGIERPNQTDSNRDALMHTLPEFGVFVITTVTPVPDVVTGSITKEYPVKIHSIYPNPVVDEVTVQFYSATQENLQIELFDNTGRSLHIESYNAFRGENTHRLSIGHLPVGFYILSIASAKGRTTYKVVR